MTTPLQFDQIRLPPECNALRREVRAVEAPWEGVDPQFSNLFELVNALGHRRLREADRLGDLVLGGAPVALEEIDDVIINLIDGLHDKQPAGRLELAVGEVLRLPRVQPERAADQQQDEAAEEEAALALQAGLAEQAFEGAVRHFASGVRGRGQGRAASE